MFEFVWLIIVPFMFHLWLVFLHLSIAHKASHDAGRLSSQFQLSLSVGGAVLEIIIAFQCNRSQTCLLELLK